MCYSAYTQSSQAKLKKRFGATQTIGEVDVAGQISGFDHPRLPIITNEQPQTIQYYQWGLIPAWANADQAKTLINQTLNAKSESIFEKPSFRDSILSKRCLVLVDGFFEWQHISKQKIKHFIHLKDGEPFAMGGVWSAWRDPQTQQLKYTFSIITTEANPLMAEIHNTKQRMPLILPQSVEKTWLDPHLKRQDIQQLLIPFDQNLMQAEAIHDKPLQLGLQLGLF